MLAGCGAENPPELSPSLPQETESVSATQEQNEVLDLTTLGSTMVYGEVFSMMMEPEAYLGRTIKMEGIYYCNYYPEIDRHYHFVVVEDATACCAQGLEFTLEGEHSYPEDYPEDKALIEITGVWTSYEDDGNTFYYLVTTGITVL